MPPVKAALVVTYLQFPIQVCFPCSASMSPTDIASVVDNLVVLIIVLAATLRGSRPGVEYASLIMTSLMTS